MDLGEEVSSDVTCHYRVEGGPSWTIPCRPIEGKPGTYSFTIPPMGQDVDGVMKLWVSGEDGISSRQSLPVAAVRFFDVTGEAAKALYYPLPAHGAQGVFVPCCNIYAGELRILKVPVNPAPNKKSLPKQLEAPFFIFEPDNLTASTSGLNLDVKYGEAPAPDVKPAIFRFNERNEKWSAVTAIEIDGEARRIRAACPSGGQLVFAWVTAE